jgi:hypothetical protein
VKKYDYFKYAYQNKRHLERWWILRGYSIPVPTQMDGPNGIEAGKTKEGYFYFDEKGQAFCIHNGQPEPIEDYAGKGTPLFGVKDPVSIKANDFLIVKEDVKSFYSNLLLNLIVFEFAFKDKIPFHNGPFSTKFIDGTVAPLLKKGVITVPEYRTYTKAIGFLMVLEQISVPAATKKVLVPPKHLAKLKKELLEKYKDQLEDPVVVSKIEQTLISEYKKHLEGDRSLGFYGSNPNKYFNNALKKSYVIFGAEPRVDDPTKVILTTPSLVEGWGVKDLPNLANSLRMGSYHRGASTALGGEAAKFSSRVFQNTRIAEEDCKSQVGTPFRINNYNKDAFVGRSYLQNGKTIEVTPETKLEIGKVYYFRSPQTCKVEGGNFCGVCMGRLVAESGIGLGPQASSVGSVFLSVALSAFHSAVVTTEVYQMEDAID